MDGRECFDTENIVEQQICEKQEPITEEQRLREQVDNSVAFIQKYIEDFGYIVGNDPESDNRVIDVRESDGTNTSIYFNYGEADTVHITLQNYDKESGGKGKYSITLIGDNEIKFYPNEGEPLTFNREQALLFFDKVIKNIEQHKVQLLEQEKADAEKAYKILDGINF